jgi:DNA integrity scanning protein DisA with diadenylate cyclase activity
VFTILDSQTVYDTNISLTKALIISEHGNVITIYSSPVHCLHFGADITLQSQKQALKKLEKYTTYTKVMCV